MPELAVAMLLRLMQRGFIHPDMSTLVISAPRVGAEALRVAGFSNVTACSASRLEGAGGLAIADESFDLCIAPGGLEGLRDPGLVRAEMLRVARLASIVIGSTAGSARRLRRGAPAADPQDRASRADQPESVYREADRGWRRFRLEVIRVPWPARSARRTQPLSLVVPLLPPLVRVAARLLPGVRRGVCSVVLKRPVPDHPGLWLARPRGGIELADGWILLRFDDPGRRSSRRRAPLERSGPRHAGTVLLP